MKSLRLEGRRPDGALAGLLATSTEARELPALVAGPVRGEDRRARGGKGVLVTDDLAEAERDVAAKLSGTSFGEAGRRVVIEEALVGQRALAARRLRRRSAASPLAPAQDYKRLGTGDTGPEHRRHGRVLPGASGDEPLSSARSWTRSSSRRCTALKQAGIDYRGVLYAGLMLTADGPKLIEYNVRFGDPEAEVVLPRLATDLIELLAAAAPAGASTRPSRR